MPSSLGSPRRAAAALLAVVVALALAVPLPARAASPSAVTADGIVVTIGDRIVYVGGGVLEEPSATVTGYRGPRGTAVTIPAIVRYEGFDVPVHAIGDGAFRYAGLTGVTIPDGVVRIGEGAFAENSLGKGVVIPASVTEIGKRAFAGLRGDVMFEGNAPRMPSANEQPLGDGRGWGTRGTLVRFYEGAAGFATPTWNGYRTEAVRPPRVGGRLSGAAEQTVAWPAGASAVYLDVAGSAGIAGDGTEGGAGGSAKRVQRLVRNPDGADVRLVLKSGATSADGPSGGRSPVAPGGRGGAAKGQTGGGGGGASGVWLDFGGRPYFRSVRANAPWAEVAPFSVAIDPLDLVVAGGGGGGGGGGMHVDDNFVGGGIGSTRYLVGGRGGSACNALNASPGDGGGATSWIHEAVGGAGGAASGKDGAGASGSGGGGGAGGGWPDDARGGGAGRGGGGGGGGAAGASWVTPTKSILDTGADGVQFPQEEAASGSPQLSIEDPRDGWIALLGGGGDCWGGAGFADWTFLYAPKTLVAEPPAPVAVGEPVTVSVSATHPLTGASLPSWLMLVRGSCAHARDVRDGKVRDPEKPDDLTAQALAWKNDVVARWIDPGAAVTVPASDTPYCAVPDFGLLNTAQGQVRLFEAGFDPDFGVVVHTRGVPPTPSPSPSPVPTPATTPTVSPSPSPSPTATPTATPSPVPTPSVTPPPSPAPSPSPTTILPETPAPSPTPSPGSTPTPSPTPMETPEPGASPTPSPISSPSAAPTPAPTATPIPIPTRAPSPSETPVPIPTAPPTPAPSATSTPGPSPSFATIALSGPSAATEGERVAFRVEAFDENGSSLGDVTSRARLVSSSPRDGIAGQEVTFGFDPTGIGGTVQRTISAELADAPGLTASADVTVTSAVSAILLRVPATAAQGDSITVAVDALDAAGEILGDVTTHAAITSDVATDVVEGATVTFPHASPHRLTATIPAAPVLSATALVEVIPARAAETEDPGELGGPAPDDPPAAPGPPGEEAAPPGTAATSATESRAIGEATAGAAPPTLAPRPADGGAADGPAPGATGGSSSRATGASSARTDEAASRRLPATGGDALTPLVAACAALALGALLRGAGRLPRAPGRPGRARPPRPYP